MENKNIHKIGKELFITSDEEIKEGDWFLTDDKRVEKCAPDWRAREWHKKIILTTDDQLIKDGVQAIDDEFLEWFVKNPSCEEVELVNYNPFSDNRFSIIIPKEEPKQGTMSEAIKQVISNQLKQETLEEVVNNFKKTDVYINEIKQEQERRYSEEETIEEYFLSSMKNVLQYKNDAQAIRFMEKYYEAKKEEGGVYNGEEVWNICNELASYFIGGDTFDLQEWFKQHKK